MGVAPPTIRTARLLLRPFRRDDASAVQRQLTEWEVASTTAAVPHPYPPGAAAAWIDALAAREEAGEVVALAVTREADGVLLGAVELRPEHGGHRADLGYWIGRRHWGRGYATEAAGELVRWALDVLGVHRVYATAFGRNPASAAVLRRIGMRHEGTLRRHHLRWEVLEDVEIYAVLAGEAPPATSAASTE
jgi:[ribosomal protein S5]-alanine N-acetyltransferase